MIVNLSPKAITTLKQTAGNVPIQQFLEELVESLFQSESVYLILKPAPSRERMSAIASFINTMLNSEKFYGFHFLTEEEAARMMNELKERQADENANYRTLEANSQTAPVECSQSDGRPFLL